MTNDNEEFSTSGVLGGWSLSMREASCVYRFPVGPEVSAGLVTGKLSGVCGGMAQLLCHPRVPQLFTASPMSSPVAGVAGKVTSLSGPQFLCWRSKCVELRRETLLLQVDRGLVGSLRGGASSRPPPLHQDFSNLPCVTKEPEPKACL
jgi:hypothetical protein